MPGPAGSSARPWPTRCAEATSPAWWWPTRPAGCCAWRIGSVSPTVRSPTRRRVDDPGAGPWRVEAASAVDGAAAQRAGRGRAAAPARRRHVARAWPWSGPNADVAMIQGGGSARVDAAPHGHAGWPGCAARLGPGVEVRGRAGRRDRKRLPVLDGRLAAHRPGRAGHPHDLPQRGAVGRCCSPTRSRASTPSGTAGSRPPSTRDHFHVTASATSSRRGPGRTSWRSRASGRRRVLLDGEVVLDTASAGLGSSFFGFGTEEVDGLVRAGRR